MSLDDRQMYLQIVTKKLLGLTTIPLIIVFIAAYIYRVELTSERIYLVALVFILGLIGGFVSLQQRLPAIELNELKSLSNSWLSILLVPINGGIFAIILMFMFLSELVEGAMFPKFHQFDFKTAVPTELFQSVKDWFSTTYPSSGQEMAKLFFWSFVAGFSERFVPQIIRNTADKASGNKDDQNKMEDKAPENQEIKPLETTEVSEKNR